MLMAQDSVRSTDSSGHLKVSKSNISKACVNDYVGDEILNWQGLGLDPSKIYAVFRPPEELAMATESFKNIPLLLEHQPTSAELPARDKWMGTVGSEVEFNDPYLQADLAVWDNEAIASIEAGIHKELSAAYRYTPIIQDGEYNGVPYQIKMTNIRGNHVALVRNGRAGSDVYVQDQAIQQKTAEEAKPMSATKEKKTTMDEATENVRDLLAKAVGKDSSEIDDEIVKAILDTARSANDSEIKDNPTEDSEPEDKEKDKEDKKEPKEAMDSESILLRARQEARQEYSALRKAEKAVEPLVGEIALDSADATYSFALNQAGFSTKGIHPSAYPAMVEMLKQTKANQETHQALIAQDSAPSSVVVELFNRGKK